MEVLITRGALFHYRNAHGSTLLDSVRQGSNYCTEPTLLGILLELDVRWRGC